MDQLELPGKWDLYEFTDVPKFNEWDKGIQAINEYNDEINRIEKKRKTYKYLVIGSVILGILLIVGLVGWLLLVVAYVFRKNGSQVAKLDEAVNQANEKYQQIRSEHTGLAADNVANQIVGGQWAWFKSDSKAIIYNDQRFAFVDTDESLLVAYDKANIKEVQRERVHTGSHSVGDSNTFGGATAIGNTGVALGSASTSTVSNTTEYYEWHFDVLTNFVPYPKVSMVVADTKSNEDAIGKAYAILKP